jgi:predicted metal-dependent hydrolase
MKKLLLYTFMSLTCLRLSAQLPDSTNDKELKERVLSEIQQSLDNRSKILDATITKLDAKVNALDVSITETKDAKEKADKLFLRVQALEDRQKTLEENELNIYQANFQSAVVNLASMEREIKPLVLFNATQDFYVKLNEASNPMTYPGYKEWFDGFKDYLKKNKKQESLLTLSSNLLTFAGNTTQYVPVVGPISSVLFAGMSTYVTSIGKKDKALRLQGEKMVSLTMKVSQFSYDKGEIEHEWKMITDELQNLQNVYQKSLTGSLGVLKIDESDFANNFSKESDAEKRYQYLTDLRQRASAFVKAQKNNNSKDWKASVYYRMMEVQSLKMRFGQLTFRISENLMRYSDLFKKYKEDEQIGSRIADLEAKLNTLKETFDKAFEPLEYVNSASRMYKVG